MGKRKNSTEQMITLVLIFAIIALVALFAISPAGLFFRPTSQPVDYAVMHDPKLFMDINTNTEITWQEICSNEWLLFLMVLAPDKVFCPLTLDELDVQIDNFHEARKSFTKGEYGYYIWGGAPDKDDPTNPDALRFFFINIEPKSKLLEDSLIKNAYEEAVTNYKLALPGL